MCQLLPPINRTHTPFWFQFQSKSEPAKNQRLKKSHTHFPYKLMPEKFLAFILQFNDLCFLNVQVESWSWPTHIDIDWNQNYWYKMTHSYVLSKHTSHEIWSPPYWQVQYSCCTCTGNFILKQLVQHIHIPFCHNDLRSTENRLDFMASKNFQLQ